RLHDLRRSEGGDSDPGRDHERDVRDPDLRDIVRHLELRRGVRAAGSQELHRRQPRSAGERRRPWQRRNHRHAERDSRLQGREGPRLRPAEALRAALPRREDSRGAGFAECDQGAALGQFARVPEDRLVSCLRSKGVRKGSLRPSCMRPARAALLALSLSTPGFALAGEGARPDPTYLPELLAAARNRSLSEDRSWLRLGHWRKRLFGGWESEADGPGLFLSPQGKRDPAAELEATLTGFFAPGEGAPDGPKPADPSLEHPQCRFPARFAWLAAAIPIDLARLPPRSCPRFDAFWRRVSARSATLVFSSYYLNNPASAFGHIFLRLGKEELASGGERLDLIDQAVDFAAVTDTSNAILYAFEGLFGFFRGEFSARPYFYKVREYADFESRDLWEYELALDGRKLALLVAHLWELGQTWFDYYYATENCSYQILGALEAADPEADLLSHVGPMTLPADSVKALFRNPRLVRTVRYRPSARTQLAARTKDLSGSELDAVESLADTGDSPGLDGIALDARVRVLDAALDLVDVRHGRDIVVNADA